MWRQTSELKKQVCYCRLVPGVCLGLCCAPSARAMHPLLVVCTLVAEDTQVDRELCRCLLVKCKLYIPACISKRSEIKEKHTHTNTHTDTHTPHVGPKAVATHRIVLTGFKCVWTYPFWKRGYEPFVRIEISFGLNSTGLISAVGDWP